MKIPSSTGEVKTGYTEQGYPWIGAETPSLTIEEFTDYQCFQCAKVHRMLRRLIAEHPDRIRLIHRQYPMDNKFNQIVVPEPFHIGSGYLALAAIAAEKQNKFWKMNDALYAIARKKQGKVNLQRLAEENGMDAEKLLKDMYQKDNIKKLQKDIWQGLKYTITGTPTFIINDRIFESVIPPEILRTALKK
jgi:protein-disulfide isomerase